MHRTHLTTSLLTTLLSVTGYGHAANEADRVAQTLTSAFRQCGANTTLHAALNLTAADLMNGYDPPTALKRQQFRAHGYQTASMTYNGNVDWIHQQITSSCGTYAGHTQFGLATDGVRLRLIVSTEANVNLNRAEQWMKDFLNATNRARFQGQKCGGVLFNATRPLTWDARLAVAATQHARDMVTLDFRGHVNPVTRSDPRVRAQQAGFTGSVGENISYNTITAEEAVKSLLTSPGHCENLMNPQWTLFGGAVNNGTPSTLFATYWVQVFGHERR